MENERLLEILSKLSGQLDIINRHIDSLNFRVASLESMLKNLIEIKNN